METNTKTPTPRTDAEFEINKGDFYHYACVDSDFARQLETELAAAQAEIEELRKDKERLDWLDKHTYCSTFGTAQETCYCVQLWDAVSIRQAIDAAMTQGKDGQ